MSSLLLSRSKSKGQPAIERHITFSNCTAHPNSDTVCEVHGCRRESPMMYTRLEVRYAWDTYDLLETFQTKRSFSCLIFALLPNLIWYVHYLQAPLDIKVMKTLTNFFVERESKDGEQPMYPSKLLGFRGSHWILYSLHTGRKIETGVLEKRIATAPIRPVENLACVSPHQVTSCHPKFLIYRICFVWWAR